MKDALPPLTQASKRTFARALLLITFAAGIFLVASDRISQSAGFNRLATMHFGKALALPAVSLTVNTIADTADSSVGDGHCDIDGDTGNGDQCTLRAAIQEANATAGSDSITFNLPANSTIALDTVLPDISDHVTITGSGPAALTVRRSTAGGTPAFRIFGITIGRTVGISGMTISGGRTTLPDSDGGGIVVQQGANVTLTDVHVTGNASSDAGLSRAGFGGGIWNDGVLKLIQCAITSNITGKGAFGGSANGGDGGGIYNAGHGILTIINSTISGNDTGIAVSGSSANHNGNGGGIANGGGNVNILNSTITNNATGTAPGSIRGEGGGIMSQGQLQLTNCTVTNNTAVNFTGGGVVASGSPAGIRNTIVANNVGGSSPDLRGLFNSQDYNLIKNTSGANFISPPTTDIVGQDPMLGPLADNGGPTQTMLPLPASPAIDAVNVSNLPADTFDLNGNGNTTEPLPIDQRGFARVSGSNPDIGAVETNPRVLFLQAGTNRVVAIDSVTFVRDPLSVVGVHNFSSDQRTRVMIFTSNLGLTQPSPDLGVTAGGIPLTVEAVGTVAGAPEISYILVKLDPLLSGNVSVAVTFQGVTSNAGILSISP